LNSQRTQEYYRGFKIVAALYKNEFQGRAYHSLKKLSVNNCSEIDDAVCKLKQIIDAEINQNIEVYQKDIQEKHKAFLKTKGKQFSETRPSSSHHRESHCYNCKSAVDNKFDVECIACGWIVCNSCGACGCGYQAC